MVSSTGLVVEVVVVVVFSLVENSVDEVVVNEVVVTFKVVILTNQKVCEVVVVNMVSSIIGASVTCLSDLHESVIKPCISSMIGWNSRSRPGLPQLEKIWLARAWNLAKKAMVSVMPKKFIFSQLIYCIE